MGPNELSSAMQCGKRLSWTLDETTYTSTPQIEDREYLNTDPIQKGLLYESFIQFLACGSDEYPGVNDDDWEERFSFTEQVLIRLRTENSPLLEEEGVILAMSDRAIQRLQNYTFESAAIKDIEQWIGEFIDNPLIQNLKQGKWEAERTITGIVSTSLGNVNLNGRIDLFCTATDGSLHLFEIKATKNPSSSHERQLEMYRQMLDVEENITKILIRGATVIISNKYVNGFDSITYSQEQITGGSPAPIVCQDCRVSCQQRILSH
jgi:hypothetical protein